MAFGRQIFGLDPSDGRVVWEHPLQGSGNVEFVIAHERVFAVTSSYLHTFHYPTGNPITALALPGRFKGRPNVVLERGHLYLGTSGEVTCFDLDGRALWVQSFKGKGVARVTLGFPGNVRQSDDIGGQ